MRVKGSEWAASARGGALAALTIAACVGRESGQDPFAHAREWLGPPETVFGRERRFEVAIDIEPADWERLRVDGRSMAEIVAPEPTGYRFTEFRADVRVDGVDYPDVEIKKKGFIGSLSVLRPSLRLDFDPENAGLLSGLRRLTLNGDVQDRSHARQCMAFDLFAEAGLPAARCSFAHVVVNGVDFGTYTNVEPVNKAFLRRFFSDDEGPLFEGTLADFDAESWEQLELESDTPVDKPELQRLVTALQASDDALVTELEGVLALDRFRDFWAMETLLGHWDGYSENANNYYLYFDPGSQRFEFIPWGLDQAFVGARQFSPDPYEITVYARARLTRRLYDLPEQRRLFRERLGELEAQLWDEDALLATVDAIARLAPDADPMAIEAHRDFLSRHGDELRAALGEPAPEIVDVEEPPAPTCPTPPRPIRGEFSIAWQGAGRAEIELELDGTPVEAEFFASGAADANDPSRATLSFSGSLDDGRSLLVLLLLPTAAIAKGTHPFHSFETFGLVAMIDGLGAFNNLGTIGDGELHFDSARLELGALVEGRFEAIDYQTACLGATASGETPPLD